MLLVYEALSYDALHMVSRLPLAVREILMLLVYDI
jgi:hypothetical protein